MHPALILLPLLLLAACATPREQCLGQATRDARINAQLIAQTEATIRRGFALRTEERVREVNRICRGVTASGEPVRTRCEEVRVTKVRVPVAVDLNAEQAKLASLKARRDQLAAAASAQVAQCRSLYPE